jgi:hypothetical protein
MSKLIKLQIQIFKQKRQCLCEIPFLFIFMNEQYTYYATLICADD